MRAISKNTRKATTITLAAALVIAVYLNWQYARTGVTLEEDAVNVSGYGTVEFLDGGGLFVQAYIQGQGAIGNTTRYLTAVGHFSQHGCLDAGGHSGQHLLGSGQEGHFRFCDPQRLGCFYQVAGNGYFLAEIGSWNNCHIAD